MKKAAGISNRVKVLLLVLGHFMNNIYNIYGIFLHPFFRAHRKACSFSFLFSLCGQKEHRDLKFILNGIFHIVSIFCPPLLVQAKMLTIDS